MELSTLFDRSILKISLSAVLVATCSFTAISQDDKFGSDPDKCKESLSLYREYYKQNNYKDAYPGWKSALAICPDASKNIFYNAKKILEWQMDSTTSGKDDPRWAVLRDSLMLTYDLRIAHMGDEGKVLGLKGVDQYEYFDDPMVCYKTLKKAHELEQLDLGPNECIKYFTAAFKLTVKDKLERDIVFDLYDELVKVIEHNQKTQEEKYKKYYDQAFDIINANFEKIADCESYINLNKPKVEAAPADTVLLRKVVKFMAKRKCTEDPFFLFAAEKLYKLEPSADAAYGLYEGYVKKKDYNTAAKYIEEAASMAEDDETKSDYTFRLANLQYAMKSYSAARGSAQQAAALKPGWGDPFVLIGDMYYTSSASCGTNECDKSYGYWAAYDQYAKAKAMDPSVSEKADSGMGKCRGAFPTGEACFFYSIQEGQSVTVGGWIGVTTTARFRQ